MTSDFEPQTHTSLDRSSQERVSTYVPPESGDLQKVLDRSHEQWAKKQETNDIAAAQTFIIPNSARPITQIVARTEDSKSRPKAKQRTLSIPQKEQSNPEKTNLFQKWIKGHPRLAKITALTGILPSLLLGLTSCDSSIPSRREINNGLIINDPTETSTSFPTSTPIPTPKPTPIPTLEIPMHERYDICPPRVREPIVYQQTEPEQNPNQEEENAETDNNVVSTNPDDYQNQVAMEKAGIPVERKLYTQGDVEYIKNLPITIENFIGDYDEEKVRVLLIGMEFDDKTDLETTLGEIKDGLNLVYKDLPIAFDILNIPITISTSKVERSVGIERVDEIDAIIQRIQQTTGREYNYPIFAINTTEWVGSSSWTAVSAGKLHQSSSDGSNMAASYMMPHELLHSFGRHPYIHGQRAPFYMWSFLSDRYLDVYNLNQLAEWSSSYFTDTELLRQTRPDVLDTVNSEQQLPLTDSGLKCWDWIVYQTGKRQDSILGDLVLTMTELRERVENGQDVFTTFERRHLERIIADVLDREKTQ